MKIFDCFQFFDEHMMLELRLNSLYNSVDYFIIVENLFMHSGKGKSKNFDIKKYKNLKKKLGIFLLINYPVTYLILRNFLAAKKQIELLITL